ncbi:MAG: DPP IV N-terminal domain-containing protein [Bacteroidota bacterium]
MKRIAVVLLFLLSGISFLSAQNKTYTLDDAMLNAKLRPENISQPCWIPGTEIYTYVKSTFLIRGNAVTGTIDTLLTLDLLNNTLSAVNVEKAQRFPFIKWISKDEFYFMTASQLVTVNPAEKKASVWNTFDDAAANTDPELRTMSVAYTLENNLYVSVNNTKVAISEEKDKNIVFGQTVHRSEWGIDKGTFWSPTGNYLAFYRMDQTMVTDYPLTHIAPAPNRVATVDLIKYPMAGMTSHQVTVGVYSIKEKTTVYLQTGEPKEQFLTNVCWSPDEKFILIAVLNRAQNHMKMNIYNASTGAFVKTLFEEKNEKYVEPQNQPVFLKKAPDQFFWLSRRDGYNHIYQYTMAGKMMKQITKGKWEVTQLLGTDTDEKNVFYMSTEDSPIGLQAYSTGIKGGKAIKLTQLKGSHSVHLSSSASFGIDFFSNVSTPRNVNIIDMKTGTVTKNLLTAENPLKEYKIGETMIFTIKADDGKTDLYCRMIKPADYDPAKKYPVFYYVYGGPHSQLVTDSWLGGGDLFMNYFAQNGFVVFTMDNRGTANRGFDFESAIYKNIGEVERKDQLKGIEFLKKQFFTDTTNFFLQGWSYGGFVTLELMLKTPNIFKAAVAGGPVVNWSFYEIMYGERYMDTPSENFEGYKNSNMLNYADKLKGKLLIIHGMADNTVVQQQSLAFLKECVDKGIQVDYFVYPEHEHNVRGKDRVHLYKKMYQYFIDNMK